jgi:hypothetical protein
MKVMTLRIKKLLLTASLLFVACLGHSQNITYSTDFLGSMVAEDDRGIKRFYKTDNFGNTVVEDEWGRNIATLEKDIFGNDIEKYSDGRKRIYGKDIFGDRFVKDENGTTIYTIKKDIFGNYIGADAAGRKRIYKEISSEIRLCKMNLEIRSLPIRKTSSEMMWKSTATEKNGFTQTIYLVILL